MEFKFSAPVNIKFGENSIELLKKIKNKNVFILTTEPLINNGCLDKVKEHLLDNKVIYTADIEPNPSCENIESALKLARDNNINVVIALGGGSVMDTAKCVALIMTNGGTSYDYLNGKSIEKAGLPLYCIPTTSGTGSEVTNVAVVSDKKKGIKKPIVSPYMLPKYALIIPSMTLTVPKHITAETGWDAFSHAIEAYWNLESNPISDAIAKDAIKLIMENIVRVYDDGTDYNARSNMSLASLMAGIAFAETRTTALHGISFRLTSHYKMSHGRACILTLLPFLKEIARENKDKMNALVKSLGYNDTANFISDVKCKLVHTNMAITLEQAGIEECKIEELADCGLENKITYLTPIEISKEKIIKLLQSIK